MYLNSVKKYSINLTYFSRLRDASAVEKYEVILHLDENDFSLQDKRPKSTSGLKFLKIGKK